MIDLVITDPGETPIMVMKTYDWLERTTVGPNGSTSLFARKRPEGHDLAFGFELKPKATAAVTVVAAEVAGFSTPGNYRMAIRLKQLACSTNLEFTLLPFEKTALAARAQIVYESLFGRPDVGGTNAAPNPFQKAVAAPAQSGDERLTGTGSAVGDIAAAETLAAFSPVVGTPLLCAALIRGTTVAFRVIEGLEANGGEEAAACMMARLPDSKDDERLLLHWALKSVAEQTRDQFLKKRIADVLALSP